MDSPMQPQVTVWFDSSCPLCVREIRLFRRLDKRSAIDFVDVLSGQACPLDEATLMARFPCPRSRWRSGFWCRCICSHVACNSHVASSRTAHALTHHFVHCGNCVHCVFTPAAKSAAPGTQNGVGIKVRRAVQNNKR